MVTKHDKTLLFKISKIVFQYISFSKIFDNHKTGKYEPEPFSFQSFLACLCGEQEIQTI